MRSKFNDNAAICNDQVHVTRAVDMRKYLSIRSSE